jgi:hypothetical protein
MCTRMYTTRPSLISIQMFLCTVLWYSYLINNVVFCVKYNYLHAFMQTSIYFAACTIVSAAHIIRTLHARVLLHLSVFYCDKAYIKCIGTVF